MDITSEQYLCKIIFVNVIFHQAISTALLAPLQSHYWGRGGGGGGGRGCCCQWQIKSIHFCFRMSCSLELGFLQGDLVSFRETWKRFGYLQRDLVSFRETWFPPG